MMTCCPKHTVLLALASTTFLLSACSSDSKKETDTHTADSAVPDVAGDSAGDARAPDASADLPRSDATADLPPDTATDTAADLPPDLVDEGLPDFLHVTYTRPDQGEPLTAQERRDFTLKVLKFLKKVRYFDYILYTTHGVDASTGKRDWQFWYNEHFKKEGDKVTFYHPENLNDGGHNLHIPFSRVLGDVLAAHLLWDDPTVALAAQQFCKGMSASMLGMVKDENDTVHHLMTRNVAAFNHEFLTHDGKKKAVDYSGWFSEYDRWNCSRFAYENNPWWGKVWITNMRSKDDVPHIFRLVPIVRYAAERSTNPAVKEACTETSELLQAFAKDIVDSQQRIRTKDKNGNIFLPGFTGDKTADKERGDLASFVHYLELVPEGECNARRSAELIGYHKAVDEECGRGEPNLYDQLSFQINGYNLRICRYFHVAHIANALINGDTTAAAALLDGLNERMAQEEARTTAEEMKTEVQKYKKDLALYLVQAASFGFPLTSNEARMIQQYYSRAVDELAAWPYWDPWADTVPEGELGGYRPPACKGEGETTECWFNVEDLAQIFESCWSPFYNPAGASYVDCDVLKDPASWDE